jgi:hypothetical protein
MSFAAEGPVKPANYKRAASVIDRVFDQTRTPLPYELLELGVVRKDGAAFHWGRSAGACMPNEARLSGLARTNELIRR